MFKGSIPKEVKRRLNKHLTVPTWSRYDDIRATAWHDATGFTIEEWQERIELYALDRGYYACLQNQSDNAIKREAIKEHESAKGSN
jgi:hypothetical protein